MSRAYTNRRFAVRYLFYSIYEKWRFWPRKVKKNFLQPFCWMFNVILMLVPMVSQYFVCYEHHCCCCCSRSCSQSQSYRTDNKSRMVWVLFFLELSTLLNRSVHTACTHSRQTVFHQTIWYFVHLNEFTETNACAFNAIEFIMNL